MESIFKTLKCSKGDKVTFSTSSLEGQPICGGKTMLPTSKPIQWEQFKVVFTTRLIPVSDKKDREKTFYPLTQGTTYVTDCSRAFMILERHTYMLTEKRKVDKFIDEIHPTIKTLVDNGWPTTFKATLDLEIKLERNLGLLKSSGMVTCV